MIFILSALIAIVDNRKHVETSVSRQFFWEKSIYHVIKL